jgi:predicted DCC family thiol-disulfide oxidoreductase YuxK
MRLFDFAPLQSATGRAVAERAGYNPDAPHSFFLIEHYRTDRARVVSKGRAALLLARLLGRPWNIAGAIGFLPTAILDWLYDAVARNRYRLFGRSEQCLVPRPEDRSRFIDS